MTLMSIDIENELLSWPGKYVEYGDEARLPSSALSSENQHHRKLLNNEARCGDIKFRREIKLGREVAATALRESSENCRRAKWQALLAARA